MNFLELLDLFYPNKAEKFFSSQLKNANWRSTTINVSIAIILNTVMLGILIHLKGDSISSLVGAMILSFVSFFILGSVLYEVGKALGGKGRHVEQLYSLSLIELGILPISILIQLLTFIIGTISIIGILGILVGIYLLYLRYLSVKAVQRLDKGRAVIAILAYLFVVIIFAAFIVLLIGSSGGTTLVMPQVNP
ncbi:YIP1 family protein [Candidatus Micrarchaeota archaeon]|nr:YIP1 family protein [Candidatus Micrarchaeota archaeon]